MKIEVRNLEYQTNRRNKIDRWKADLFINDELAFTARYNGKYMAETILPGKEKVYKQAETWCQDHLPVTEGILVNKDGSETKFPVHTSIYTHVQDLASKEINRLTKAKHDKEVGEAMKTHFIIGVPGTTKPFGIDFGEPIRDYLATEGHKKVLKEFIAQYVLPELKGNKKVQNTNFTKATLVDLGIPEHLIHTEEVLAKTKHIPKQRQSPKKPRKGLS